MASFNASMGEGGPLDDDAVSKMRVRYQYQKLKDHSI
jgi:hypothetical protein